MFREANRNYLENETFLNYAYKKDLMVLFEFLAGFVTWFISSIGYSGTFILMLLESTMFPVPSELILPFAGFMAAEGTFNIYALVIVSTLGTIAGSLLSYCIGYKAGKPFVMRYGKYFLLNKSTLDRTHKFFEKYGGKAIFISRMLPVVRHIISLPAGAAKMNLKKFVAYTAAGGAVWNTFLLFLGLYLRGSWNIIINYTQYIDIVIIIGIVAYLIYFIYEHKKT